MTEAEEEEEEGEELRILRFQQRSPTAERHPEARKNHGDMEAGILVSAVEKLQPVLPHCMRACLRARAPVCVCVCDCARARERERVSG